jgi:hypothetical protein
MIEPDAEEEEPTKGRRRSRPMRIGAALVVVLLAWGTLWLARPRTSAPQKSGVTPAASPLGDAPVQVGSRFICNRGEQLRAFKLGMAFYPPNHPFAPPTTAMPDRCFRTVADAEVAGYTVGKLPAGPSIEVSGIYMVAPNEALRTHCMDAAQQLGFSVPCPDLLPWPGRDLGISTCSFDQAINLCTFLGAFSLDEDRFAVPVGHQAAHSNLVVLAFEKNSENSALTCPNGARVGTYLVKVQNENVGIPANLIDCPLDSADLVVAGHLILRWKELGVTYEVALEGNFDDTLGLLQAIASTLQVIGPPPD